MEGLRVPWSVITSCYLRRKLGAVEGLVWAWPLKQLDYLLCFCIFSPDISPPGLSLLFILPSFDICGLLVTVRNFRGNPKYSEPPTRLRHHAKWSASLNLVILTQKVRAESDKTSALLRSDASAVERSERHHLHACQHCRA